jgi:peptidoglycan/xylan/chitin deacetylase (PgdA/CDA1 family)
MMLLAISVDLDETYLYRGLHGLDLKANANEVYARALPRLSDWARQRNIPLTWFAVGKDVDDNAGNCQALSRLASYGDELGCHTYSHYYDLTRRSFGEMQREVVEGARAVERAAGVPVKGFRAPGYVMTDRLLDLLREAEFTYDSSIFPCPSYYALKVAVLARMAVMGTQSSAIIGHPNVLRAPISPYRVGRPYWSRGSGISEIPIQVTPRARLPFIGTALTVSGNLGAKLLAARVAGQPLLNLELHGVDALDESDGLADLAPKQRDLCIPWSKKLDALDAAVSVFRRRRYGFVRMDELAARAERGQS